jgi:hypothetical protein
MQVINQLAIEPVKNVYAKLQCASTLILCSLIN